ncbi:hypothetical protein Plhal304r1_c011g0044651 [Plasmopara halstedii]
MSPAALASSEGSLWTNGGGFSAFCIVFICWSEWSFRLLSRNCLTQGNLLSARRLSLIRFRARLNLVFGSFSFGSCPFDLTIFYSIR